MNGPGAFGKVFSPASLKILLLGDLLLTAPILAVNPMPAIQHLPVYSAHDQLPGRHHRD